MSETIQPVNGIGREWMVPGHGRSRNGKFQLAEILRFPSDRRARDEVVEPLRLRPREFQDDHCIVVNQRWAEKIGI